MIKNILIVLDTSTAWSFDNGTLSFRFIKITTPCFFLPQERKRLLVVITQSFVLSFACCNFLILSTNPVVGSRIEVFINSFFHFGSCFFLRDPRKDSFFLDFFQELSLVLLL